MLTAPSQEIYIRDEPIQVIEVVHVTDQRNEANNDLYRLISETFPEESELMIEVAEAESNFNTNAYNPEWHYGCQGSYGLMQIACVNYEGDPEDLFDPSLNLAMARKVYESQGIGAWGVCVNKVECE